LKVGYFKLMQGYNDSGYGYGYGAYSPELQGSMNVPAALPVAVEFLDNFIIAGSPSFEIGAPVPGSRFADESPAAQMRANEAIRNNSALQERIRAMREKYAGIIRGV
jgi:hypothetical protein